MTDKIIIDGVDVSGCLFYQANFEEDYDVKIKHYCSNWHNSCESNNNSNCYYKNWQRKEQECEELKTKSEEQSYRYAELDADCERINLTNERLVQEKYDLHQDILKLKAENEELKRQLKVKGKILKLTNEAKNEYLDENNKLKQLLQSYISDYKKMYEANTTF